MIDTNERRDSIRPLNKNVKTMVIREDSQKTEDGILLAEGSDDFGHQVRFKEDKLYIVEVLEKSKECMDITPDSGYAIVFQLSGFGIPTHEKGYIKMIHESMLLMSSKTKVFNEKTIVPGEGRALVRITSTKVEELDMEDSEVITNVGMEDNIKFEAPTLGGVVISVAKNVDWVVPGDKIRFDSYIGSEILIGDETYRMVQVDELLAKIVDNEPATNEAN